MADYTDPNDPNLAQAQDAQTPATQGSANLNDVLSLLTAIGGLGGNIAGALTGRGAAGDSMLPVSATFAKQADASRKAEKQAVDDKHTIDSYSLRLGELPQSYRAVAQAYADNGNAKGVQHIFEHNENVKLQNNKLDVALEGAKLHKQQFERSVQNDDLRDAKGDLLTTAKSVDAALKESSVERAKKIQELLTSTPTDSPIFKDPGSFAAALAGKGIKLTKAQAEPEFEAVSKYLEEKKQGGVDLPVIGKVGVPVLNPRQLPNNSNVFSDFVEKHTTPEAREQHQTAQSLKQVAENVGQAIHRSKDAQADYKILQNVKAMLKSDNPNTRKVGSDYIKSLVNKRY